MENWRTGVLSLLLTAGLYLVACTDPPVPKLSYYDREIVDSLYLLRYDSLKPELDTMCVTIQRNIMLTAVDSIMEQRLREIAKLKNRYSQQ